MRTLKRLFDRLLGLLLVAGLACPSLLADDAIGKKGAALITGRNAAKTWKKSVEMLNVDWHYSWGGTLPEEEVAGVQFVPMIWSCREVNQKFVDSVENAALFAKQRKLPTLLGFNEPDQAEQANMPVERAIAAWPTLMKTNLRLGSPVAANAEGDWMKQFMAKAKELNYRVDFVCVHWYGGPNAKGFLNRIEKIHQLYGKPIWITEFAPADWKAKSLAENKVSREQSLKFMQEVLPALDNLDYVERYAWFNSSADNPNLGTSVLFDKDRSLTELGKVYAGHKSRRK